MNWNYKQLLDLFSKNGNYKLFTQSNHGLEREGLRTNQKGKLAKTKHQIGLGSKLTNPNITTDFTEAQLELVTPVFKSEQKTLDYLKNIHLFVNKNIGEELIWPFSMPCILPRDSKIPFADYGTSHTGKKKTLYRLGLSERYNRRMQTVSGIHYNFSFSDEVWDLLYGKFIHKKITENLYTKTDFISETYLHIIRNFLRYGWIYTYLFGAAPVVDKTYLKGKKPDYLKKLTRRSYYSPYACSFRMSELGYYSKVQSQLAISFNSLKEYLADLQKAITTPEPKYKNLDGMNSNILQQESEHYSRIRPKRVLQNKETPIKALSERGIQYIEVRCVDLNPMSPLGVGEKELQFLHIFILYCLFQESPEIAPDDNCIVTGNQNKVAIYGRKPGLTVCQQEDHDVPMIEWAEEILKEMIPVAKLLDKNSDGNIYQELIKEQLEKLKNPELTPSAQLIKAVQERKKPYINFGLNLAKQHKEFYGQQKLAPKTEENFREIAEKSIKDQHRIEVIEETILPGYDDMEVSTQILIREAFKRKVQVDVIDRADNFIILSKGRKVQYVKQATKTDLDSYMTFLIMENKNVTNQVLRASDINVPPDGVYYSFEESLKDYEKYRDIKVVFKPTTTNFGVGISFAEPGDYSAYESGLREAFKHSSTVLVERFFEGEEYRLLTLDFEVISIVKRVPANVVGDGKHTIRELIEMKNDDPRNYKFFAYYTLKTGKTEAEFLHEQGLTFNSVPAAGQQVFTRKNSNVSTGGDPLEVFDQIDQSYKKLAEKAAHTVNARICGVDMLIQNPESKATNDNYAIIELNFNPAIQMHHYPVTGKPVNVAAKLLDMLGF
ncbi:MAG: glutamate--cysteine ligase [Patescibacteria group bacterium]